MTWQFPLPPVNPHVRRYGNTQDHQWQVTVASTEKNPDLEELKRYNRTPYLSDPPIALRFCCGCMRDVGDLYHRTLCPYGHNRVTATPPPSSAR